MHLSCIDADFCNRMNMLQHFFEVYHIHELFHRLETHNLQIKCDFGKNCKKWRVGLNLKKNHEVIQIG